MKQIIAFLFLLITLFSYSQNQDIKLIEGKIPDAKVKVDNQIKNPELNTNPQVWYNYAYVYKEIAKSEVFAKLDATPEEKSLKGINECKRYDKDIDDRRRCGIGGDSLRVSSTV